MIEQSMKTIVREKQNHKKDSIDVKRRGKRKRERRDRRNRKNKQAGRF